MQDRQLPPPFTFAILYFIYSWAGKGTKSPRRLHGCRPPFYKISISPSPFHWLKNNVTNFPLHRVRQSSLSPFYTLILFAFLLSIFSLANLFRFFFLNLFFPFAFFFSSFFVFLSIEILPASFPGEGKFKLQGVIGKRQNWWWVFSQNFTFILLLLSITLTRLPKVFKMKYLRIYILAEFAFYRLKRLN